MEDAETIEVFRCEYFSKIYLSETVNCFISELSEMAVGERFVVTKVKVPKQEFESLPEFDGF